MKETMRRCLAMLVLVALVIGTAATMASADAEANPATISSTLAGPSSNVTDVDVGIYVNGISNFDFGKVAYSLDFYLCSSGRIRPSTTRISRS
jgi:hypothetical protein